MPSSAMLGLYDKTGASPRSLADLHNTDIKKLVSVLRSDPWSPEDWQAVKKSISTLPEHLRSSTVVHITSAILPLDQHARVKPGHLCLRHSRLNAQIVCDIWSKIKFEFDEGVDHILYPVIRHGGLLQAQSQKIRQLEPVLRMWHPEFTTQGATPADHEPIISSHWGFQDNECPACMLSRIGADKNVVFALMVGLIARYSERVVGTRSEIKSKRVKFVQYWLKAFEKGWRERLSDGDVLVDEAWDVGMECKRIGKCLREHHRAIRGPGLYRWQMQEDRQTVPMPQHQPQGPEQARAQAHSRRSSNSDIGVDISLPFDPYNRPANPTLGGSSIAGTGSHHESVIGVDISEPALPSNGVTPHSRSSSLYSRTTYGHPTANPAHPSSFPSVPNLPAPLTDHQAFEQRPNRRPFSGSTTPTRKSIASRQEAQNETATVIESPHRQPRLNVGDRVQSLHLRISEVHSEYSHGRNSFDTDDLEQEAHDAHTYAPHTHTSLYPAPLTPRSHQAQLRRPQQGNIYAGVNQRPPAYDGEEYGGYDVSPPDSPGRKN